MTNEDDKFVPWTAEQIESANGFQHAGIMHPFTCNNGCGELVATEKGWVCTKCSYTQKWAHGFMLDGSWKKMHPFHRFD